MRKDQNTASDAIYAETVLDVIRSRRNVKEFNDEQVADELIEKIIEAATWAPNHRHTEPWRFIVVQKDGSARRKIAEMVYDWTFENVTNPTEERRRQSAEAVRREVLGFPVMMYVYSAPGDDEEITQENYAATCCAVQNMLLAAHAYGLSVGWSTGRTCKTEGVGEVIGADPDWQMVGSFSIGYSCAARPATRSSVEDVASWV